MLFSSHGPLQRTRHGRLGAWAAIAGMCLLVGHGVAAPLPHPDDPPDPVEPPASVSAVMSAGPASPAVRRAPKGRSNEMRPALVAPARLASRPLMLPQRLESDAEKSARLKR